MLPGVESFLKPFQSSLQAGKTQTHLLQHMPRIAKVNGTVFGPVQPDSTLARDCSWSLPATMKSCPGCLFLQRSDTKARTFWFIEHPYLEPASLGPVHRHWHAEGSIAGNALVGVKNTPVLCPPSPLSAGGRRVPGFVTCS